MNENTPSRRLFLKVAAAVATAPVTAPAAAVVSATAPVVAAAAPQIVHVALPGWLSPAAVKLVEVSGARYAYHLEGVSKFIADYPEIMARDMNPAALLREYSKDDFSGFYNVSRALKSIVSRYHMDNIRLADLTEEAVTLSNNYLGEDHTHYYSRDISHFMAFRDACINAGFETMEDVHRFFTGKLKKLAWCLLNGKQLPPLGSRERGYIIRNILGTDALGTGKLYKRLYKASEEAEKASQAFELKERQQAAKVEHHEWVQERRERDREERKEKKQSIVVSGARGPRTDRRYFRIRPPKMYGLLDRMDMNHIAMALHLRTKGSLDAYVPGHMDVIGTRKNGSVIVETADLVLIGHLDACRKNKAKLEIPARRLRLAGLTS